MIYALVILLLCGSFTVSGHLVKQFSFPIGSTALYRPLGRIYLGAKQATAREFSLSSINRAQEEPFPLTPSKVTLNQQKDQQNPLFDEAINHLVLLDRRPVLVPQGLPTTLFLIDDRFDPLPVVQSAPVRNAEGEEASSLLAVTTTAAESVLSLENGASLAAIAAVPNPAGGFDGNGSGIALSAFRQLIPPGEMNGFFVWDIFDARTGASAFNEGAPKLVTAVKGSYFISGGTKELGNRAIPFGKDTPQLMISSPVKSLDNKVDLHFDRDLGRLYIATRVTASDDPAAGARGVVVASIAQGKVMYHAIAPDAAFNGTNLIVGKKGAGSRTTIYKVRTMQTRTHLRYLIVVGGNGDDPSLEQAVFALPLVDNLASEAQGTLASVKADPISLFSDGTLNRFRARVFAQPARSPADLYTMESPQARVGGKGTLPGPISDIEISTEAVFVSCLRNDSLNNQQIVEGIFYSQPVFDQLGRIGGWTDWHRVADSQGPVTRFEYDPYQGLFWLLPEEPGTVASSRTVLRTEWTDRQDEFVRFISGQLREDAGGVLGLFDYGPLTTGFVQEGDKRIALQIFTGLKKLLIVQSGSQIDRLFRPQRVIEDIYSSLDGTMSSFTAASTLSFSGGALETVGAIRAAAILTHGSNGWFVIAGEGGIAILADSQGRGWQIAPGLGSRFAGLTSDFRWQLISKMAGVRKLIAQEGKLFALSDSELVRFTVTAEAVAAQDLSGTVLHETKNHSLSFSDFHIKGPLALIGTSAGLLRSGNGVDVRSQNGGEWVTVTLQESVGSLEHTGPISRIYAITTVEAQDNLYLLNSVVSLNQGLIYRVVVSLDQGQVTDSSVHIFPDALLLGIDSFFTNLGVYRNFIVTDGALIAVSRSAVFGGVPLCELLMPTLRSAEITPRNRVPFVLLPSCTVGALVRSSASGAWMIPGDFGIREQL